MKSRTTEGVTKSQLDVCGAQTVAISLPTGTVSYISSNRYSSNVENGGSWETFKSGGKSEGITIRYD